jgi:hypothetical protein
MTMHAARRLNARDGSFKGIVSAGLNLDYFARFYRGIDSAAAARSRSSGSTGCRASGKGPAAPHPGGRVRDAHRPRPARRNARHGYRVWQVRTVRFSGAITRSTLPAGGDGGEIRGGGAPGHRSIPEARLCLRRGVTLLILALMASAHFCCPARGNAGRAVGKRSAVPGADGADQRLVLGNRRGKPLHPDVGGIAHWRMRVPADYLGKRRWELAFLSPLEGGWERHQETVQARQPFRDFVVRHTDFDGNVGYASVSGEPLDRCARTPSRLSRVGRDVTAEIRLQQRLKLQHRVSAILANARSAQAAVTEYCAPRAKHSTGSGERGASRTGRRSRAGKRGACRNSSAARSRGRRARRSTRGCRGHHGARAPLGRAQWVPPKAGACPGACPLQPRRDCAC